MPLVKKSFRVKHAILFLLIVWASVFLFYYYRKWREDSFDKEILVAATKHNMNPALIKAIIWKESGFNPNAIGKRGEIGLMQIMPPTAREWAQANSIKMFAFADLFQPSLNIDCGTWYLKKAVAKYTNVDNPLPYALAEYNAGRGNVLKWMKGSAATNSTEFINQIGFPSTKNYVLSVIERFQYYHQKWQM